MSTKNLSTVATDVIAAYGITATNVINTYRFGGERLVQYVDERFAAAVNQGVSMLRKDIRSNLIDNQQRVTGYCVKGVNFGSERVQSVVGVVVDLANKGVSLVASNAERFDRAVSLTALQTLNRVVMPAASVVSMVAERLEEGSGKLVQRVAGNAVPAKAVASRKLKTVTREATVARKRVTKAATKRVSKVVADTATSTSNVARRVARKAKATGAAA